MVSWILVLQFNLAEMHARAGECPQDDIFRRDYSNNRDLAVSGHYLRIRRKSHLGSDLRHTLLFKHST